MSASDPKTAVAVDDIASAMGLSIMMVSRALSDKRYVPARSRKVILVRAKKLDCRSNMMARQFMSNRTSLLGMIAPYRTLLGAYYFGRVL